MPSHNNKSGTPRSMRNPIWAGANPLPVDSLAGGNRPPKKKRKKRTKKVKRGSERKTYGTSEKSQERQIKKIEERNKFRSSCKRN